MEEDVREDTGQHRALVERVGELEAYKHRTEGARSFGAWIAGAIASIAFAAAGTAVGAGIAVRQDVAVHERRLEVLEEASRERHEQERAIAGQLAGVQQQLASIAVRVEAIEGRLVRIEQRLDQRR